MTTPVLRGWKEIAAYLKVSIKTAKSYRKKKLPIGKLGGVVSNTSDIDQWLKKNSRD